MKLSSNQKGKLLRLYYPTNDSVFSFLNTADSDKKNEKLENAKQVYANYGYDEEVIFLLDDTFFGSADEGIVITNKAVYTKKALEEKKVFKIKDITTCKVSGDNKIKINSSEIEMVYLENSENLVVKTINKLRDFYVQNIIKSKNLDIYSTITIPYTLAQSGGTYKDSITGYTFTIAKGRKHGTVLSWEKLGKEFNGIKGKLTLTINVAPKIVERKPVIDTRVFVSCSNCGYKVDTAKTNEDKIDCPLCATKIIIRSTNSVVKVTKEEAIAQIKKYEWNLEKLKEFQNDKEVVLVAVGINASVLEVVSEELRDDKDIILLATKDSGYVAMKYASKKLRNNKKIILKAVKNNCGALNFIDDKFKSDKEVALASNGKLNWFSKELRADKEVVLHMVSGYGGQSLEYASEELRADKEVVLKAVTLNGTSLKYASKKLQADKEVVLIAIKDYKPSLEFASKELQSKYASYNSGDIEKALNNLNNEGNNIEVELKVPIFDDFIENEGLIVTCVNCNSDTENPPSDICPHCKESISVENKKKKQILQSLAKVLQKKNTKQVKKPKQVSKDTLTFNKYTTVKKLRNEFKKITGLTLRVYYKNKIVSDELSMQDINAIAVSDMKISTRMKIGTIEKSFKELNLKVQIASSDNEVLCSNKLSLAKAKEKYI